MPKYIVQLRRGTTEEWETIGKDIVPLEGELVLEYDNGLPRIKIGNGRDIYAHLPYMSVDSFLLPKPASVSIYANRWVEAADNRWYQVVDVENATITERSKVDLQPSAEQLCVFHEKDLAFVAENEDGVISVYCVGQVPENDYTIQVTITETSVGVNING